MDLASLKKHRLSWDIIEELKSLIMTKGYIYALCMVLFDDFHINPEELHEINRWERLNDNEASLLLGFLIQDEIDFTIPDSSQELMRMKKTTYKLMRELHDSFMAPFIDKIENEVNRGKEADEGNEKENYRTGRANIFGSGDVLTEAMFYSGSGAYDTQYLEILDKKYKYDAQWLADKYNYDLNKIKLIVKQIKEVLQNKSQSIRLYGLKERAPEIIDKMKKDRPNENIDDEIDELLKVMEFHQYSDLFIDIEKNKIGFDVFCINLINMFVVRESDINKELGIGQFFNLFSVVPGKGENNQFQNIGNYNKINSHPIIKIDAERYFVPICFFLFQAIYERPFYWMIADKEYRDRAAEHRGQVGEEIAYDYLLQVFGRGRVFKGVKVLTKKGASYTDIDVLCVLGSKAMCVQVKSKQLTLLSRGGNDEQLQKDFRCAVQGAYEQGIVSRSKILEKDAKYIDDTGGEISLKESIDEVYVMCVVTENYPSLTHQAHVMLDKKEGAPFPIVLTLFDLELLVYYLNDPYEFLYYVRQRVSLMDYFHAGEEIAFLGYHLTNKLWKIPGVSFQTIDDSWAQLIDRNYYPFKAGIEVSDKGDRIKQRWRNEKYEILCSNLAKIDEPKITDIIFHLYDWSGEARENLIKYITLAKQKMKDDGKSHDFSILPDCSNPNRIGISYYLLNNDDIVELREKMLALCHLRKYKSKGDIWIGLGSLKNSRAMIDMVAYGTEKWEHNTTLEEASKKILNGKGQFIRLRKIGRNEKCPCGSGLKYKKCCGKNGPE